MTEKKDLPSPGINNGSIVAKTEKSPGRPTPSPTALSPSQARQAAAKSLSQPPKPLPGWKQSALAFLSCWMKFVLIPVIAWVLLTLLGVIPVGLRDAITMGIAILLFIVGMPVSILFRLDALLRDYVEYLGHSGCLVVLLIFSGLNVGLLGAIRGWFSTSKPQK